MKQFGWVLFLSLCFWMVAKAEGETVVFSEIAWMGTQTSTNDEWIELTNLSEEPVELSGWKISSDTGSIEILLEGVIEPGAYFLLERTDDTTVSDIEADQIYTGALKNSDLKLLLTDPEGTVTEEIEAWPAGDNKTKASMEKVEASWCTNDQSQINGLDADGEPILGTPGQANSTCSAPVEQIPEEAPEPPASEPEPEAESSPEPEADAPKPTPEIFIENTPTEPEPAPPPVPLKNYEKEVITFKEVLPNPEGTDKGNESFTLINNSTEVIDLREWKVVDARKDEYVFPAQIMAPKAELTLVQSEFKINLNNSDEILQLFDGKGNLIDEISWKTAASGQPILPTKQYVDGVPALVTRVVDGDTFVAQVGEQEVKIRLIGVDTPESVHPRKGVEWYAKKAHMFLESKILNQEITLDFEERKMDRYNRVLAYAYLKDELINASIIQEGCGYAYTRFPFEFIEEFKQLENEAKKAKRGLWESKRVGQLVAMEKHISRNNFDELKDIENTVLLENIEKEIKPEPEPEETLEEPDPELAEPKEVCLSEDLKIEVILPAPVKGEEEFIRIKNEGLEKVCLNEWKLDDMLEKGSKAFIIPGGAIAPGGVRTFRKSETKLTLNNKDDCANLINPYGEQVDQICYEKAHTGEKFSHTGGDYVPKPKTSKGNTTAKHSFKRQLVSYQWELADDELEGTIEKIDEQEGLIYLMPQSRIPISYSESPIDIQTVKQMVNLKKPVAIQYRNTSKNKQLISINQTHLEQKSEQTPKTPTPTRHTPYLVWVSFILGFTLAKSIGWIKMRATNQT